MYPGEEDAIAHQMAQDGHYNVQHAEARDDVDDRGELVGWERGIKYLITGFTRHIIRFDRDVYPM